MDLCKDKQQQNPSNSSSKQHLISEKPCIPLTLLETIFKPPKCIAKAKVD